MKRYYITVRPGENTMPAVIKECNKIMVDAKIAIVNFRNSGMFTAEETELRLEYCTVEKIMQDMITDGVDWGYNDRHYENTEKYLTHIEQDIMRKIHYMNGGI